MTCKHTHRKQKTQKFSRAKVKYIYKRFIKCLRFYLLGVRLFLGFAISPQSYLNIYLVFENVSLALPISTMVKKEGLQRHRVICMTYGAKGSLQPAALE